MASPSIPLLRALRATETIRTSLPGHRHASSIPKALSSHLNHGISQRTCLQRARTSHTNLRNFTSTAHRPSPPPSAAPKSTDRGPVSEESTQTDFGSMDVFSNAPAPTASIDACTSDGFHLDNGVKIGGGSGLLLVAGEAFTWRPWEAGGRGRLLNQRGQWDTGDKAWGILEAVWPKPGVYEYATVAFGRTKCVYLLTWFCCRSTYTGIGTVDVPFSTGDEEVYQFTGNQG